MNMLSATGHLLVVVWGSVLNPYQSFEPPFIISVLVFGAFALVGVWKWLENKSINRKTNNYMTGYRKNLARDTAIREIERCEKRIQECLSQMPQDEQSFEAKKLRSEIRERELQLEKARRVVRENS